MTLLPQKGTWQYRLFVADVARLFEGAKKPVTYVKMDDERLKTVGRPFNGTMRWFGTGGEKEEFQGTRLVPPAKSRGRGELAASMKEMMRVLKPGGTLGVVQHRGTDGADAVKSAEQGYVPQAWLVAEIEKAGFKLVEASEINANPKDTHDHPEGVWNLPPTLTHGDKDRAKYEAIGESDRMTLKFQKPA